jgi:RNA polymerase sigma-70 factor (ECF subfamily)
MEDLDEHLPAIAAGDPDAFGRWLAGAELPIRASLRGFAVHLDTEALLQETLLRVWQVAHRVVTDGRGNALLRLALAIARNLALSELRRARADPREVEELERAAWNAAGASVEPAAPDPILRRVIEACRRALPRQPALALQLRLEAAGGESDDVLAVRAGMKRNTFLQNFGRARKLLAACLAARGIEIRVP